MPANSRWDLIRRLRVNIRIFLANYCDRRGTDNFAENFTIWRDFYQICHRKLQQKFSSDVQPYILKETNIILILVGDQLDAQFLL